jgi:hypothetical protein
MKLPVGSVPVRMIEAPNFTWFEPGKPCSYWSSGEHILVAGKCRCGVHVLLAQIDHERWAAEVAGGVPFEVDLVESKTGVQEGLKGQNTDDKL